MYIHTWSVTLGMVCLKWVSMKRPFLVHLTVLTDGFESTEHSSWAVSSFSTLRGFSGPTTTLGKSVEIKFKIAINRHYSVVVFELTVDEYVCGRLELPALPERPVPNGAAVG